MIRKLIFIAVVVSAMIVGISFYLQPNDLSGCSKNPGTVINCQAVDAVVAVSGGDTNARVDQAIDLYKNGWSSMLIFSGAAQDKTGPSNAAAMKQRAMNSGVPAGSIYIDENSETTKQNAVNTAAILTKIGAKKIILVTSGYHQRRASLEFNKYIKDITILNSPDQNDKNWSFYWWITPSGWWLAGSELVKIVMFYMFGV